MGRAEGRIPGLDDRKITTANILLNTHCALSIGLISMCQLIGPYHNSVRGVLMLFLVYR